MNAGAHRAGGQLASIRQGHGKLALIFGDEIRVSRQELEDRDHGLSGLLADALPVTFDEIEAEVQRFFVLASGGQCFGELELEALVIGLGSQGRERIRRCRSDSPDSEGSAQP